MDRRQQKTRIAIFSAFTALLSEKSYSRISVQDIIDRADVGRTTFYAHFETKDYLLKELCAELFDHITDSAMGHSGEHRHFFDCSAPDSVFLHLIQHLQKNDNHVLNLLSSENSDIFRRYFKSNLKKLVVSQYGVSLPLADSGLPRDYVVNHIAASFVETADWWISRKMKESPEEITEYFLLSVFGSK